MVDKKNIIDKVIDVLVDNVVFFHTKEREAFAIIYRNKKRQVFKVESGNFANEVRLLSYNKLGVNLKSSALKEIADYCGSYAKTVGVCKEAYIRYANREGNVYVDLALKSGKIIRIDSEGYQVLTKHKATFYRPSGQKPLVLPEEGKGFQKLKNRFPNMSLEDFKLGLSLMIYTIHSKGPFPVLILQGEQ